MLGIKASLVLISQCVYAAVIICFKTFAISFIYRNAFNSHKPQMCLVSNCFNSALKVMDNPLMVDKQYIVVMHETR